jgi:hypothetical protein
MLALLALISNYDAPTRCILGVTLSPGCHPDPDHIRDQSSKWRKLAAVDEPASGTLIETVNEEKELTTAGGSLGAIAAAVEAAAPELRGRPKADTPAATEVFQASDWQVNLPVSR